MNWYAFRTQAKCEFKAEKGLNAIGFETFIPVEKKIIIRCRRKHIIEPPLFPRYGFVQFDIERDNWGQIHETDGVDDILSNNQTPVSIPPNDIERLKLAAKYGLFDRTKKPSPFKMGDNVEIAEGPFAGIWGKVIKARSADRINILLSFFGSTREVEFSLLHLRANHA